MMSHFLIARLLGSARRESDEARRVDVLVIEQRRELGGNDLVADTERAADARADETIERVGAPPQAASHVADNESPAFLVQLHLPFRVFALVVLGFVGRRRMRNRCRFDIVAVLAMQA